MDQLRGRRADVPLVAPSYVTGKPLPAPMAAALRTALGGSMSQIIRFANTPLFLTSVVPSSSTVSTAEELSRFAEIWRRGGELDGVRVLRPETLRARRPSAGGYGRTWPPASRRCGGVPVSCSAPTGSVRSAGTPRPAFGHTGLTNVAVWTDPQRGLAASLVSSGKPVATPKRADTPS